MHGGLEENQVDPVAMEAYLDEPVADEIWLAEFQGKREEENLRLQGLELGWRGENYPLCLHIDVTHGVAFDEIYGLMMFIIIILGVVVETAGLSFSKT